MLQKLDVGTLLCQGGACTTLEHAILNEGQWRELIVFSALSIREAGGKYARMHRFEHRRLVKIACRNLEVIAKKGAM